MESKLTEIKSIQEGEFYFDSKIFLITENCLLLIHQDGTTYRKYSKTYPHFDFTFALDSNNIILIPRDVKRYIKILNLTTGDLVHFNLNLGRKLKSSDPIIIAGKVMELPFVSFYYSNDTSSNWNLETRKKVSSNCEHIKRYKTPYSRPVPSAKITKPEDRYKNLNLQGAKEKNGYLEFLKEKPPSDYQINLPDGRIIQISGESKFALIQKDQYIKFIQIKVLKIEQICLLSGSNDTILCLAFTYTSQHQIQTFKFPINGEPFPLESYNLNGDFNKILSINQNEVLLFGQEVIEKLNLVTNKHTKNFLKENGCDKIENRYSSVFTDALVVPTDNKFKILRCLLLVKLKKLLPRDLVLETYSFFS